MAAPINAKEADWITIKTDYITGEAGYKPLAQKYGVSYRTLADRGKAEKWPALREQYRAEAIAKTLEATKKQQVARAMRLQTAADKLLQKVELMLSVPEDVPSDPQWLRDLARVIMDIKQIQDIRSPADLQEQEARIANLRRQAAADDAPKAIAVTIQGGEDDWSN